MKGLFLKDLYMMRHYCKIYLLITAAFLAASRISNSSMFFVFYPCLLCGMIPVNLLGYDERSHFLEYSATLPYTGGQIVSEKYLLGLFTQVMVLIIIGIMQGIKMQINGGFVLSDFMMLMLSVLCVSAVASSISLPFIFKYGMEKGRLAYYVMIGFICAAGVLFAELFQSDLRMQMQPWIAAAVVVTGVGIYALSWYMSIVFYRKREL